MGSSDYYCSSSHGSSRHQNEYYTYGGNLYKLCKVKRYSDDGSRRHELRDRYYDDKLYRDYDHYSKRYVNGGRPAVSISGKDIRVTVEEARTVGGRTTRIVVNRQRY